MQRKKIGVVSLGCPKNLVDSEIMLGLLESENYEITNEENEAQILIVNTCGFIESAKQESVNTILELADYKKGKCELLIVTGCLAERYKDKIIEQIPEVDAVIGTGNYGEIARTIEAAFHGQKTLLYGKLEEVDYLKNKRIISTKNGYAYLKIAEGCDNCCTYCIIPSLRGRYRSRPMEDLVEEARFLAANKVREIILVAQDTTRYGMDLYKERKLVELIKRISEIEEIEWIRLLYCYPEEIDQNLLEEMSGNDKLCKYLDIPIQHVSDDILKRMGRRGTGNEIKSLINQLKEKIPEIVIRTSMIVGFPGETEENYKELFEFVRDFKIDRLGVFAYSREEDTKAAKFSSQIPKRSKEKRRKEIMNLQKEIHLEKNQNRLSKVFKTLVEGVAEDGIFYFGRTYGEAPDIDGVVYFTSKEPLNIGEFVHVKMITLDEYDLIGEVVDETKSSK
ncbi:MAG: 30S ribosomal protein S12 methylthiotransferase RimO [Clostridia bacterium]|nr:30S ribosomal protein S12 methylthiotransferase RimO [Clostridia bacterium]